MIIDQKDLQTEDDCLSPVLHSCIDDLINFLLKIHWFEKKNTRLPVVSYGPFIVLVLVFFRFIVIL